MKMAVKVQLKEEILDTQGRALESLLRDQGFSLKSCHVGKYILIDVEDSREDQARQKVQAMAEKLLHNPLIENYEVETL